MSKAKKRKRKEPSNNTKYEMGIRADKRLNLTTRLIWFLVAMSHGGYTSITEADMAEQLRTNLRQIQISLKFILATGYFRKVKPKGVHRPMQYHRVYDGDESPEDFICRIQADARYDVTTLMHWIACDQTPASKTAQFPLPKEWEVSAEALRAARNKMRALGYFSVDSDPKRGTAAIYTRVGGTASVEAKRAAAAAPTKRINQADEEKRRERELDQEYHKAVRDNLIDAKKREFEETEFGTGKSVMGSRKTRKKPVVSIFPNGTEWYDEEEEDV